MKILSPEEFNQIIAQAPIKPRLKQELRFTTSVSNMTPDDWNDTELLCITDKSGNKGILLLAPDDDIFAIQYELTKNLISRQTGRGQPIICDFCRTWQSGGNAASISFKKDLRSLNSVSFLCCADLKCSQHVRGKTAASRSSKAQLRESLTNEQRINRLKNRLHQIIADLR